MHTLAISSTSTNGSKILDCPQTAIEVFRKVPIFTGLRDEALTALADAAKPMEFEAGELILRESDPGDVMFIIERGAVQVLKQLGTEHETTLATLGPRNFFGEMCVIESVPRCASVRATEPTLVFSLKGLDLYRVFKKWPDQFSVLILNICRDLCRRLRTLDEVFSSKA